MGTEGVQLTRAEKIQVFRRRATRNAQWALAGYSTYCSVTDPDRLTKLLHELRERVKTFPNITNDPTRLRSSIDAAEVGLNLVRCTEGTLQELPVPREVLAYLKLMLNPRHHVPDALKGLAERVAQVPQDQDLVQLRVSSEEAEALLERIPRCASGDIFHYSPSGILSDKPWHSPRMLCRKDGPAPQRGPWDRVRYLNLKPGHGVVGPPLGGPGTELLLFRVPECICSRPIKRTFYLLGMRNALKYGTDDILFKLARLKEDSSSSYSSEPPKRSYIELATNSEIGLYGTLRAAAGRFAALCGEACRENANACQGYELQFVEYPFH